jgi:methionyl aminopeptidase
MSLKTRRELELIYKSGQITGRFLDAVAEKVRPGVTTAQIDAFAAEFIAGHDASAAFLGYRGFPASVCISVNDEVVHGIPGPRVINEGDLVSVDVGVVFQGYYSDAARSYYAGSGSPPSDMQRLMEGTERSLSAGIEAIVVGGQLRNVSRAIEQVLLASKLRIVRDLTGHGTGHRLHEEPTVYNYDPGPKKFAIQNGLVIAIEPMASLGSAEIILAADNWTYRTADGSLAAHYEHTVACWDGRPWVMTDPADEDARSAFARAA